MNTINVKGPLLNPANQVSPNTPIRLTSVLGYGDTLLSSTAVVTSDGAGNYDFSLVYGTHMIEVRFEDKYIKLGTCIVSSGIGPLTINELLVSSTPILPEYVATVLQAAVDAREAADRAEQYAKEALETGAMIEAGSVDLSGGIYPEPLKDLEGNNRACFWKVTASGTVSGVDYGIGDSLVYSAETDSYYKIDNTESVTSVNGKQGVVELSAGDVGALPAGATAVNSDKLDNIDSSGFQQLPVANIPAPLGGYLDTYIVTGGVIKIILPQGFSNSMISFTINIYNYSESESTQIRVSGYSQLANSSWSNPSILPISGTSAVRVRLGYDGSKCCAYIGDTTTYQQAYIQVAVTDVVVGYFGSEPEKWSSGWEITTGATAENVDYDVTLNNWDGVDYVDPDAIGANATAKIYPDGSIVGQTDNGSYTKWPNGELIMTRNPYVSCTANVRLSIPVFYPIAIVGSSVPIPSVTIAGVSDTTSYDVLQLVVNGMNSYGCSIFARMTVTQSYSIVFSITGRWK